ncbi:MAG TPA: M28 family peptidase, partial [Longimicrobiales bacterium]
MTAGGTGPMAAQAEMPAGEEQTRIGELLERIARPRLCGSAGAAEVDGAIRGELERLGYEVRELPFTFSALPGRWAVPAAGVLLALAGIISAACAAAHNGAAALAVLAVAVALLIVAGANAGDAIRRLPWQRLEGVNWLATRPGARPSYLVSAHRDSKSQAVPLLARAAAIVGALVSLAALFLLDLVALIGPERWHLALPAVLVALVAAAAGTTLALCIVRNDSPGALDNASGLVALLALAARERGNPDVGFLLTDAEELGLAGASAV